MSALRLVKLDPTAASRVKHLRSRAQLTQEALGALLGVAASTVSSWECRHSNPSRLARIRLSEYEQGKIKQPVKISWVWR